jgi:hypothetical protein
LSGRSTVYLSVDCNYIVIQLSKFCVCKTDLTKKELSDIHTDV